MSSQKIQEISEVMIDLGLIDQEDYNELPSDNERIETLFEVAADSEVIPVATLREIESVVCSL